MLIEVNNKCSDFKSYRAARVKSLFNVESGCNFNLSADLPIDDGDWKIGLIVGPSGSGKTSIGHRLFGGDAFYQANGWDTDKPIVDCINPDGDFDGVTAALSAVGLGDVPAWLRPYQVLSNGEKFRADLARIIAERPERVVIDEFTSVVDRQIARVGSHAFAKAWRRCTGQAVLLSCHYDIIEWLEPDWVYDTATGKYSGRSLWRRPEIHLDIYQTNWRFWHLFEPHHYLKPPRAVAATNYVGVVNGELVAHVAVSTTPNMRDARACRLVVMPEWQGIGVGMKFFAAVCEMWLRGENPYKKSLNMINSSSHPGFCAALRRDPRWRCLSSKLCGKNKKLSAEGMKLGKIRALNAKGGGYLRPTIGGLGGHFRALQGFRYYGEAGVIASQQRKSQ